MGLLNLKALVSRRASRSEHWPMSGRPRGDDGAVNVFYERIVSLTHLLFSGLYLVVKCRHGGELYCGAQQSRQSPAFARSKLKMYRARVIASCSFPLLAGDFDKLR